MVLTELREPLKWYNITAVRQYTRRLKKIYRRIRRGAFPAKQKDEPFDSSQMLAPNPMSDFHYALTSMRAPRPSAGGAASEMLSISLALAFSSAFMKFFISARLASVCRLDLAMLIDIVDKKLLIPSIFKHLLHPCNYIIQ